VTHGLVDPKTLYVTSETHHAKTAATRDGKPVVKVDNTIGRRAISQSVPKAPSVMERLRNKEPLKRPLLKHGSVEENLSFD
jgi:hypothetical protein